MSLPGAETLLRVWEEHLGAHPIRRALALLDAAWPDVGLPAWAGAAIGERDACLLLLHEQLFGPDLHTVAHCPACDERLESSFRASDIRAQPATLPSPQSTLQLDESGYAIAFRLPSSMDLLTLADQDEHAATRALLNGCVMDARREGRPIDASQLPSALVDRLAQQMQVCDPAADVRIALVCPACRHAWSAVFDIVAYIGGELEDWAQRMLADVHLLATHYHWSERDILALSPGRRRLYLDMVLA